ncbi:MAG: CHAT domain-containing protein, partial [Nannocystaceae bacterium]
RATVAVLRDQVPGATLLHFAGHAEVAGLVLADRRLDVPGILMLPGSARTVVLIGCDVGRADPESNSGGMTVARALLAIGSESVIATSHALADEHGLRMSEALYAQGILHDGAAALRDAQLALLRAYPDERWHLEFHPWVR